MAASGAKPPLAFRASYLKFDLLCEPKRIHFDAEITNSSFDLCVAEQELNRSKVPRLAIELRDFGSPERVRAEGATVELYAGDPPVYDASIPPD